MYKKLSPSELEVMEILWNSPNQLTSAEIMERLSVLKDWKPGTIWSFLGRLTEKGSLVVERVGKINYYSAAYTRQDYKKSETMDFVNDIHKGSLTSLYTALTQGNLLDENGRDELKKWLNDYKEE